MFVVVAGSLRVLLPCVCVGAFVRAYLMLTLIWTFGSHFFSLIIFLPSLSFDYFFFFFFFCSFFFSSLLCVCQECACAKSLIVHNQELDVTLPARCQVYDNTRRTQDSKWPPTMEVTSTFERFARLSITCSPFCTVLALGTHCHP